MLYSEEVHKGQRSGKEAGQSLLSRNVPPHALPVKKQREKVT